MIDETQEILCKLIGIDTTSSLSNMDAVNYISNFLSSYTQNIILVHDEYQDKASILASFGPVDRPGIVLSGHTDVVPVKGQQWSSDPFRATVRDGRIY